MLKRAGFIIVEEEARIFQWALLPAELGLIVSLAPLVSIFCSTCEAQTSPYARETTLYSEQFRGRVEGGGQCGPIAP